MAESAIRPKRRLLTFLILSSPFLLPGCEEVEKVVDSYRDLTPHEAYAASLRDAGLAQTALARAWTHAAGVALASPSPVTVPHREEGYLAPDSPAAVGLRFGLQQGQLVRIRAELTGIDDDARLFLELFRVPEDSSDAPRPVQRADTVDGALVYEAWRDGDYVVRLQPELLRGGRYRLTVAVGPSLDFPVAGRGEAAIQSFFGAPRDGGARDHHGVDIFAPTGTPALAAADALVRRVRETRRGGRVVWLRDEDSNQSLYYAHLDRQLVEEGQRVEVGDTVGLVGNTGNARTTPPHLHFGIYRRGEGPVNPVPFLRQPSKQLPALPERTAALGAWLRSDANPTALRVTPDPDADVATSLPPNTPVRVIAGADDWFRVRLPDGRTGWLGAARVEPAQPPVGERVAVANDSLRAAPAPRSAAIEGLEPGTSLAVLGRWQDYLWVRTPDGAHGWLART